MRNADQDLTPVAQLSVGMVIQIQVGEDESRCSRKGRTDEPPHSPRFVVGVSSQKKASGEAVDGRMSSYRITDAYPKKLFSAPSLEEARYFGFP